MTDEELGREAYEREALNWPSPIGWDNLSVASKSNWIQRAKGNTHVPNPNSRRSKAKQSIHGSD